MAGHSHWANIQHKKAAKDKKKGKVLSKLVKLLYVAVKEGNSGKPEENPRLRLIIDKCRAANMPKDTIKRAIDKMINGGLKESVNYHLLFAAHTVVRTPERLLRRWIIKPLKKWLAAA